MGTIMMMILAIGGLCVIMKSFGKERSKTEKKIMRIVGIIVMISAGIPQSILVFWGRCHPMTTTLITVALLWYISKVLVNICSGHETGGVKKISSTVVMIFVIIVVGSYGLGKVYESIIGGKMESVSESSSRLTKKSVRLFEKNFSKFWHVEESDFNIYIDRSLVKNFDDNEMYILEERMKDFARTLGNDDDDKDFENFFIGGRVSIDDGEICLISCDNGGKSLIDVGMMVPQAGSKLKCRPGIGITEPCDINIRIYDDNAVVIMSSEFAISIDSDGTVHCGIAPNWNK